MFWVSLREPVAGMTSASLSLLLGFAMALFGVHLLLLLGLAWRPLLRPLGAALLIISAALHLFMQRYGIVIDPSMVRNALATDWRETRDLIDFSGVTFVLLWGGLPALIWWWLPIRSQHWRQAVPRWAAMVGLGVSSLAIGILLGGSELGPLMRAAPEMRYRITPLNLVYGAVRVMQTDAKSSMQAITPIGTDVQWVASEPGDRPPLMILVVGETARAANFSLYGYERPTSPELDARYAAGELVRFDGVLSCGTNTEISVPCLFSPQGSRGDHQTHVTQENLLDVLQRAGVQVLWIENQSGCKGVCDRVPTLALNRLVECPEQECLDAKFVEALPGVLDQLLDPNKPAVVVLHLMGSHGPAYARRSETQDKVFGPECTDVNLRQCDPLLLRNAYDHSIRHTDRTLGGILRLLETESARQRYRSALVYVSDHGESLGERGIYLHGLPLMIAPEQQREVPFVWWALRDGEIDDPLRCVRQHQADVQSHDALFHTTLGWMDVSTSVHDSALDANTGC